LQQVWLSHLQQERSLAGVLRLRAGLINEPLSVKPIAHFYTGSKANWWPISDGLPQFEGAYVAPAIGAQTDNAACGGSAAWLREAPSALERLNRKSDSNVLCALMSIN
jgi:hypothetical protein